jgi:regulatory protein
MLAIVVRGSTKDSEKARSRELSARDLEEAALRYLNRFDASAEKLERHLTKMARRAENADALLPEIPALIERYRGSGLIDDRRFAEARARSLRARGASSRLIQQKLAAQGVPRDVVDAVLDAEREASRSGSGELEAAVAYVRRKRLGAHRPAEQQALERRRDLARLARQGFDYETALRALALGRGDEF